MKLRTEIASPKHYDGFDCQPIDVMAERMTNEQYEGFLWGNALKYLMRYGYKDKKLSDVTKAITYLSWLAEFLEDYPDYEQSNSDESNKEEMS